MRNCKGYVYLELMAAFSVCILLVLAILPMLEEVLTHRKDISLRTEAHHLLYERLTAFMDGGDSGSWSGDHLQKKKL
ncbi:hypothetical protein [Peribacillus frigoritolerans]|uniref:hypothetical protein n=1 Tax=Peribacillus frigoritolerans TaxID=450367 RepID=UPI00301A9D9A